ncbi:complement component receptor 1-like protein [Saccostrea cucullata]|uniref:complement component receptor 1-like protein n=1 Tax=Saccostrea cuccullata TaxID=36930 RepID=UPI002ED07713
MKEKQILSAVFLLLNLIHYIYGTCTKPVLPANAYALTEDKTSYAVGEKYTIVCLPSYTLNGESDLICQIGGTWSSAPPTCVSDSIVDVPWWVLLLGVVGGLILIPCCLPRIIFCFMNKKKNGEEDDEKALYRGGEKGGGMWRGGQGNPVTPITDRGKHQLHKM